jgi:hypothetical protein
MANLKTHVKKKGRANMTNRINKHNRDEIEDAINAFLDERSTARVDKTISIIDTWDAEMMVMKRWDTSDKASIKAVHEVLLTNRTETAS